MASANDSQKNQQRTLLLVLLMTYELQLAYYAALLTDSQQLTN